MIDWIKVAEMAYPWVAGTVLPLTTPWFAWKISRYRETDAYRRELVKEWRRELLDPLKYLDDPNSSGSIDHLDDQEVADKLLAKPSYRSLERHLSEEFKRRVRELANPILIVGRAGGGRTPRPPPHIFNVLSDEIARIEKRWDLV